MKVIGSGSPEMLTVRVRKSEIAALEHVLCRRREEATSEAARVGGRPRLPGAASGEWEAEGPYTELFLITRMLDQLREHVPDGQSRKLVGPTELLDPIIRDAASEAVERLSEAVDVFRADTGKLSADAVRTAVDAAAAGVASLIGLDHAQNDAIAR